MSTRQIRTRRRSSARKEGPPRRAASRNALPFVAAAALVVTGCSEPQPSDAADGQARTQETAPSQVQVAVTEVTSGLVHPWGMAILPDGRMLVTERPGRLRYVGRDGAMSEPIGGVPEVRAGGQGGLLDVVLDPDFEGNRLIYLSYAEPGPGGTAGTAVARGRLEGERLSGVQVIFRQEPKVGGPNHFGSRLVFSRDGALFVTLGERFQFDPAQDNSNHLGTIVRIDPDGSVPEGNPFAGQANTRPEIWSYGHRNIEAAAIHPGTGQLWVAEMGPQGGDELNLPESGRNYGWPLVSWGEHYDGRDIPDPATRPDLAGSIHQSTPVISPSGMIFYSGDLFPAWRGNLLIGGLSSRGLLRLTLDGERVTNEDRIDLGRRIREVEQGRDGAIFLLTDEQDGRILRLSPSGA